MGAKSIRGRLEHASSELEDVCETADLPEVTQQRLSGKAEQLAYLAGTDPVDPEAVARPRPDTLDTIREHLTEAIAEVDDDTARRLKRVRNEVLEASSLLMKRGERGP